MGQWGYMPNCGDSPLDEVGRFEKEQLYPYLKRLFEKKPRKAWGSHDRWTRLGVVQVMLNRDFWIPNTIAKACLADLKALQGDEDWLDTWRCSKTARKSVGALISAYESAITATEDRRLARRKNPQRRRRNSPTPCYTLNDRVKKARSKIRFWQTLFRKANPVRFAKKRKRRRRRRSKARG